MSGIISLNANGLRRFGKSLRNAGPETVGVMNAGLLRVAEEGATAARAEASWSTRIPGSIRAGGTRGRVWVRAGGARAPHAPAYEHHGQPGKVRHPVFGQWLPNVPYADARPFLTAPVILAADKNGESIAKAIADLVERMP